MAELKEKQLNIYDTSSAEEVLRRKRAIARKKRLRRKKQIRAMIVACLVLVVVCVTVVALLVNSGKSDDLETSGNPVLEEEKSPYEEFSFYKEENAIRYEAYAAVNPDMDAEDVVWRVNANQDKTKYEFDIPVTDYSITTIVNKYYKVPDDYKPDDLALFEGYNVRKEAGDAYVEMREAMADENLTIYITSGYRSVEYQSTLYNYYLGRDPQEEVDRYSARPGYSEHHLGLAIDIGAPGGSQRAFVNTPEYEWIKENCHKYGFIIRYLEETEDITGYEFEPWHLRYVGVEVSTDMKNKGINNFEEYHVKYLE